MRFLLVSHHAPPHIGGVESVVLAEAMALVEGGHEVVWVTSDGAGAGQRVPEHPRLRLLRVRALHLPERLFRIAYPLFAPSLLWHLWREVGRADVVHVHGLVFPGSPLAAVFARLRGRWCVATEHGGLLHYRVALATLLLRALFATSGKVTAAAANRLIAINGELETFLRRLGGDAAKVHFAANRVDAATFRPPTPQQRQAAREALGWDDRPRVLCIARLLPHKGVDVLLAAQHERFRLVFCGPGTEAMRAHIRAHGAECLEPRPREQIVALYHAADAFALPSHNEGFPVVIQEALACGLPVVTSDLPAYAPYRALPGLHLCEPTAAAVGERLLQVLAAAGTPVPTRGPVVADGAKGAAPWLELLLPPPGQTPAPRSRLAGVLALLLVLHVVFCAVRWPVGAVRKRAQSIAEFTQLGAAGWHLRHCDEETRRIAAWLVDTVPPGDRVLCRGGWQGSLQLLAPLLHPRLLVDVDRLAAAPASSVGWRPFAVREQGESRTPVVVGERYRLRLEWR